MTTETKAGHSPLPWKFEGYRFLTDDGREICMSHLCNAEFIVRAVNNHEALVRALEWAMKRLGDPSRNWSDEDIESEIHARYALANAREKG